MSGKNEFWSLTKDFTFEAAHKLPYHDGKCQKLHGHSWKMTVECRGDKIQQYGPKQGMMLDYADIKKAVQPIVDEYLDHNYLNETTEIYSPTSEALCKWVFDKLDGKLEGLFAVTIYETCTSSCTYWKEEVDG